MSKASKRRSDCPISFALDMFGDKWSLLIVRDLMFRGKKTYGEFLGGPEGIATNILASRLEKLEGTGIISKSRDPENGTKFVYSLTERGADLIPVMLEMIVWSGKHDAKTAAPRALLKEIATRRKVVEQKTRKALGF